MHHNNRKAQSQTQAYSFRDSTFNCKDMAPQLSTLAAAKRTHYSLLQRPFSVDVHCAVNSNAAGVPTSGTRFQHAHGSNSRAACAVPAAFEPNHRRAITRTIPPSPVSRRTVKPREISADTTHSGESRSLG
jgi:hypothetical protein